MTPGCFRPIKDTILRANHNRSFVQISLHHGVSDLSKIQFWEQITTDTLVHPSALRVFQTYQRYNFESKSQLAIFAPILIYRCFRPIKDTILRANHNFRIASFTGFTGVSDLSKIQFWEQITTISATLMVWNWVFQTYQRYNFESKSQHRPAKSHVCWRCFRPIKDTILRANHNCPYISTFKTFGVSDLSKIQFWEQITTHTTQVWKRQRVFQTYQRYNFESKSQLIQ